MIALTESLAIGVILILFDSLFSWRFGVEFNAVASVRGVELTDWGVG